MAINENKKGASEKSLTHIANIDKT